MDEKTRQRSLKVSFVEGIFGSIMFGLTLAFTTPFALALGATRFHIGVLNAAVHAMDAFSQLISAKLTEIFGSRLNFVTYMVLGQGLLWFAICSIPYITSHVQIPLFIILLAITIFLGAVAIPPWASLMSDTVEKTRYGVYFAWRQRNLGFIGLGSTLLAGLWLYASTNKLLAFVILFGVAGTARLFSGYFLSRMTDVPEEIPPDKKFSYWEFIRRLPESNFVKFTLFTTGIVGATYLLVPFLIVYMINDLKFNPLMYTLVITSGGLSGLVGLLVWGRFADRYGNVKIMRITGMFTPLFPLLWLVSSNLIYIIAINIFAGYLWQGFYLCMTNFTFDATSPPTRTRCLGYLYFTQLIMMTIAPLLGGILVDYLPATPVLWPGKTVVYSGVLTLCIISGVLRLMIYLIGARSFKEVRPVEKIRRRELISIVLGIRPMISLGQNIFYKVYKNGHNENNGDAKGNGQV